MFDVFICYSRENAGFALKLCEALEKDKREVYTVRDRMKWPAAIREAIESAANFVFIVSPQSCSSTDCRRELAHASKNNKRIIPLIYGPVPEKGLPRSLIDIDGISFYKVAFAKSFELLKEALDWDREWIHGHTCLLRLAKDWKNRFGKELSGSELQDARRWLAQASTFKDAQPSALHQEYIRASEESEAERLRHWEQAEKARDEGLKVAEARRVAEALDLVAFSTLSLEHDLERSVLLAMHAVNATRCADGTVIPEAEDALHRAILQFPIPFTLKGHSDKVQAVSISENGRRAVSTSCDNTMRAWDVECGRELWNVKDPYRNLLGVTLSGAGHRAVSTYLDGKLRIWAVGSWERLRTLFGHTKTVNGVALSEDGKLVISASDDRTLKVWNAKDGRELRTLKGHTKCVNDVALSRDGRLAVSASADHTLKAWDVETGRELRTLTGHTKQVNAVAMSEDGRLAVSASADHTLKAWDAESGLELVTLRGHSDSVNAVALSGDGKRIASAGDDKTVRIWDTQSGKELITLVAHEGSVRTLAWSRDGRILLSAGDDKIIYVHHMDIASLLSRARSCLCNNLTLDECKRYLHRDDIPPIPS